MSPFTNRSAHGAPVRTRYGRALGVALFTMTTLAGVSLGWRIPGHQASRHRELTRAVKAAAVQGDADTTIVLGPVALTGPTSGGSQTYVEKFTAATPTTTLYTLQITNGTGGHVPVTDASVTLNGVPVVARSQFSDGPPTLTIPLNVTGTSDTLVVSITSPTSSGMSITVTATTSPGNLALFGPDTINNPFAGERYVADTVVFTLPGAWAAPPYSLVTTIPGYWATNVYIVVNGDTLVNASGSSPGPFGTKEYSYPDSGGYFLCSTNLTGSDTLPVTLSSTDTVVVGVLNEPASDYDACGGTATIVTSLTATDSTHPVLAVTAPVAGSSTNQKTIAVTGTVTAHSTTGVTVNGTAATISGSHFSATVPIAELANALVVSATNATNLTTDSVLEVYRDTVVPTFTIANPMTGPQLGASTLAVNGTVHGTQCLCGPYAVQVSANGIPMTVQPGVNGAAPFAGQIPVTPATTSVTITGTDVAGNVGTTIVSISSDTTGLGLTVSAPANNAATHNGSIAVTGVIVDTVSASVTVNGIPVSVGDGGAFTTSAPLVVGTNTLTTTATDVHGHSQTVNLTVTRSAPDSGTAPALSADNAIVPSTLSATRTTSLAEATSFLYSGSNPTQVGVSAGTIVPSVAGVVRGRVLDRTGAPIGGVTIAVVGHPEFGTTTTTSAGQFDMAMNGGGPLRLSYAKAGYLSIERQPSVPWQDYAALPDAIMIPVDSAVTAIDFTQAAPVAQGTIQSDSSGSRRATMIFEQGTVATAVMPDSSTFTITNPRVRATEFTVGSMGPQTMPAALPATSAYTYAVGLSVDQADSAGATTVQFSQPVTLYVDDYLGFPVGTSVPLGYYDPSKGAWVPEPNGDVIQVLSTTGGVASVDVDGSGNAADSATLATMGFTTAELQQVATLDTVGQTLSRMQVSHFSSYDANYPSGNGLPPQRKTPKHPPNNPHPQPCHGGSVIGCDGQTLGEAIALTNAPYTLRYVSDRTPGYLQNYAIQVPLTDSVVDASMLQIILNVKIAGQSLTQTFAPAPNLTTNVVWNGLDAYGRVVQGIQPATVSITFTYACGYGPPAAGSAVFGSPSDSGVVIVPHHASTGACPVTDSWTASVGSWDARAEGLGGWTLDVHHSYDPVGRVLYLGTGETRDVASIGQTITTIAGQEAETNSTIPDSVPAKGLSLPYPLALAAGPDGSVYVATAANVLKITPAGEQINIAGSPSGSPGFSGDGGPATSALVNSPYGLAIGPDGSLYIADQGNLRIRKINPSGIISTIAGTGRRGYTGDGGPATAAEFGYVFGLAVTADGTLYVADDYYSVVRKITPDGIIATAVGTGTQGETGDSAAATKAKINSPQWLALGPDGSLFVLDGARLRRVWPNGIITTVIGDGVQNQTDGNPALTMTGGRLDGVAVGADGTVYTSGSDYMYSITPDGIFHVIAGNGSYCPYNCNQLNGDGGLPLNARLTSPTGVAILPDSNLLVLENYEIREISPPLPNLPSGDILIASEDGSEVYQFDSTGRHLHTMEALTGATTYTFGYDSSGHLLSITDRDSLTTTIASTNGVASAITGPYGQAAAIAIDGNGFLSSVTDPAGEEISVQHQASGLLAQFTDARGQIHTFTYDSLGRMISDQNPYGATTLVRFDSTTSYSVQLSTALGRTTTYRYGQLPTLSEQQTVTDPTGLSVVTTASPAGAVTTALPDGTVLSTTVTNDPRFAMEAPLIATSAVTLPTGTQLTGKYTRHVTLANNANPLSVTSLLDSAVMGGRAATFQYLSATRTITVASPLGRKRIYTLDSLGRTISSVVPGYDAITYTYDSAGSMIQMADSARRWLFGYDARGRLATASDPLLNVDSVQYDSAGRIVRHVAPNGTATTFAYDGDNNIVSVTPPSRAATTFQYTGLNADSLFVPPAVTGGSGATTYSYNADGQLSLLTLPDSSTIASTYDAAGRVATVELPRGSYAFSYSPTTGHLASVTAPDGGVTAYNSNGPLLTNVTWSGTVGGVVAFVYDSMFRVSTISVNGGAGIAYRYDADGLLASAGSLSIGRDSTSSAVTSVTLGTMSTTRQWNAHAELSDIHAGVGASALFGEGLAYDAAGHVIAKTDTVASVVTALGYSYDSLGRLTAVTIDSAAAESFQYDGNGNRTQVVTGSGSITPTYDGQDRLLTYGNTSFTYTTNGQLLTRTDSTGTTTFTYDGLGNLLTVILADSERIDYVIDGGDQRIGKLINGVLERGWLYEGQLAPAAELDSTGSVATTFIYGSRANVPDYMVKYGRTYSIITDAIGSVRLVVDSATDSVAQRIDYDALGQETENTNPGFQPFGFAGGLSDDDTRLIHFGARDYDPTVGRWTAPDPAGFNGGQTNLYVYAFNNPITYVDPLGLWGVGDPIPPGVVDFAAGFGDVLSFGLTDQIRNAMGTNDVVNKCSTAYTAGQVSGVAVDIAVGGAAGYEAAEANAGEAGFEFSHWIPNRSGGPRSLFNGNYVSQYLHYLTDDFRFPPGWREWGPKLPAAAQQLLRIPWVYVGGAAGAAAGIDSMLKGGHCGCR